MTQEEFDAAFLCEINPDNAAQHRERGVRLLATRLCAVELLLTSNVVAAHLASEFKSRSQMVTAFTSATPDRDWMWVAAVLFSPCLRSDAKDTRQRAVDMALSGTIRMIIMFKAAYSLTAFRYMAERLWSVSPVYPKMGMVFLASSEKPSNLVGFPDELGD